MVSLHQGINVYCYAFKIKSLLCVLVKKYKEEGHFGSQSYSQH